MSYLNWHVGMKVVCKDNNGANRHLVSGQVYTVNSIEPDFVGLAEPSTWTEKYRGSPAWLIRRFRPVQTRKTDISVFTALLNPSDADTFRELEAEEFDYSDVVPFR